jgi:hypothetical protein
MNSRVVGKKVCAGLSVLVAVVVIAVVPAVRAANSQPARDSGLPASACDDLTRAELIGAIGLPLDPGLAGPGLGSGFTSGCSWLSRGIGLGPTEKLQLAVARLPTPAAAEELFSYLTTPPAAGPFYRMARGVGTHARFWKRASGVELYALQGCIVVQFDGLTMIASIGGPDSRTTRLAIPPAAEPGTPWLALLKLLTSDVLAHIADA